MKIGLIQSQGIGDIIIALPIAKWYTDRGHQVFWPVNRFYADFMQLAAPYVNFLPVQPDRGGDFMAFSYDKPMDLLAPHACDKIFVLNMNLEAEHTLNRRLSGSLKFDEYKYAVAGVPFSEKWNLSLVRDMGREMYLHSLLKLDGQDYVCVNFAGSGITREVYLPQSWQDRYRIVRMDMLTDNPLDWIYTIQHAARRVMIDSMFANLTDQLNIAGHNYLIQRSTTALTPVLQNGWTYVWPLDTIEDDQEIAAVNV